LLNCYDGHTLGPVITALETLTGVETRRIHVEKGYRGHNHPHKFGVWISGQVRRVTATIRREMRRPSSRSSAISRPSTAWTAIVSRDATAIGSTPSLPPPAKTAVFCGPLRLEASGAALQEADSLIGLVSWTGHLAATNEMLELEPRSRD
jgi:hypothetical protein